MSKMCQVCGVREGKEIGQHNPFGDDLGIIVCEHCLVKEIKDYYIEKLMSDKMNDELYNNFWADGPFHFPQTDSYLSKHVLSALRSKAASRGLT